MKRGRRGIYTAYAVLILLVFPFGYFYTVQGMRFFAVPSGSMLPTLQPADYLVTFERAAYEPGDVVVLRDPQDETQFIVKRIVAIGGQTVSAQGGGIYLNGRYVSEPYLAEPIGYNLEGYPVEEGHVFVLGDNRNESLDSHNWRRNPNKPEARGRPQSVPKDLIVGRVSRIYLPFGRIQRVRSYPLIELRAG